MISFDNMIIIQAIIIFLGYLITLLSSGCIVKSIIGLKDKKDSESDAEKKKRNLGKIVGKCENLIALTFILANQITGLALIFAAKSIIRKDETKTDPTYYLGGTLVNFCFSVLMGYIIKLCLSIFNCPISSSDTPNLINYYILH